MPDNFSALDLAVKHGKWALARLLVEAGADMSPPSFKKGRAHDESPLLGVASSLGPSQLVELMLMKGADPNYAPTKLHGRKSEGWTALHAASENLETATIRVLCEWGADVNAVHRTHRARTPLHMAAIDWGVPSGAVPALVVAGADPFELDVEGRTVVEARMGRGDERTMEVLLDSRPSRFDM